MKLFLDTNVILDLLAERAPHYTGIAEIATLADRKEISILASALSYTTVFYMFSKHEPAEHVREKMRKFSIICPVATVDENIIEKALNSDFPDFEDAVQYFTAVAGNCDMIITRNGKDFKSSHIPFMTAEEYLTSR